MKKIIILLVVAVVSLLLGRRTQKSKNKNKKSDKWSPLTTTIYPTYANVGSVQELIQRAKRARWEIINAGHPRPEGALLHALLRIEVANNFEICTNVDLFDDTFYVIDGIGIRAVDDE